MRTSRRLSSLMLIFAILLSDVGSTNVVTSATPLEPAATSSAALAPAQDPAPPSIKGIVVETAKVDPAWDAPPAAGEAVVVDRNNPAWQVHYGTQAGRTLLPPRAAPQALTTHGPQLPLTGTWLTTTLQSQFGTATITAIAAAPDGRLFVGVSNDGLRVYAPDGNGVYSWSAIHASFGGLASESVTSLAVFDNELWIGTSDQGISALNLNDGTWREINQGTQPLLPSNTINRMTVDYGFLIGYYIWIATPNGATRYQPYNNSWTTLNTGNSGLNDNRVFDIAVHRVFVGFGFVTVTWFSTSIDVERLSGSNPLTNWTDFGRGNT